MPRYVALLRGINVGRNKRLAMADLRRLLDGLGYTEVRTLLQSGNAVFTTAASKPEKLARQIEQAVEDELGLDVKCLVRTGDDLRAVIDGNPLGGMATDGAKLLALFLSETPDATLLTAHDPTQLAPTEIQLGDGVIYQWCPDGVLAAPPVSSFAEKHLEVTVTGRNWNTVTKLAALLTLPSTR